MVGAITKQHAHDPSLAEQIASFFKPRKSKSGILLSWAIPGQGGDGHANEQNNSYIKSKMANLRLCK